MDWISEKSKVKSVTLNQIPMIQYFDQAQFAQSVSGFWIDPQNTVHLKTANVPVNQIKDFDIQF
jgi:hypothetical protein